MLRLKSRSGRPVPVSRSSPDLHGLAAADLPGHQALADGGGKGKADGLAPGGELLTSWGIQTPETGPKDH